jgi:hypothetical protein
VWGGSECECVCVCVGGGGGGDIDMSCLRSLRSPPGLSATPRCPNAGKMAFQGKESSNRSLHFGVTRTDRQKGYYTSDKRPRNIHRRWNILGKMPTKTSRIPFQEIGLGLHLIRCDILWRWCIIKINFLDIIYPPYLIRNDVSEIGTFPSSCKTYSVGPNRKSILPFEHEYQFSSNYNIICKINYTESR